MMNFFVCVVPQLHVNILMLVQCQKPFFWQLMYAFSLVCEITSAQLFFLRERALSCLLQGMETGSVIL